MSRIAPLLIATGLALGTGCGAPESDPSAMPPEVPATAEAFTTDETRPTVVDSMARLAVESASQTQTVSKVENAANGGSPARRGELVNGSSIFNTNDILDNPFGLDRSDVVRGPIDADVARAFSSVSDSLLQSLQQKIESGAVASSSWLPVRDAPDVSPQVFRTVINKGELTTTIDVKQDASVPYSTQSLPTKAESYQLTVKGPDGFAIVRVYADEAYVEKEDGDAVNVKIISSEFDPNLHLMTKQYFGPRNDPNSGVEIVSIDNALDGPNAQIDAGITALNAL